jgi:HSP20 family protein
MGTGKFDVDVEEKREPFTDIITTENEVKVIAELPGAEKRDIRLYATEDRVTIHVDKPQRKYYKELKLPAKVDVKRASSSYKNGVLEVSLPMKNEGKPEGEPIRVD